MSLITENTRQTGHGLVRAEVLSSSKVSCRAALSQLTYAIVTLQEKKKKRDAHTIKRTDGEGLADFRNGTKNVVDPGFRMQGEGSSVTVD